MATWSKLREFTISDLVTLCLLWFYLLLIAVLLHCLGLTSTHGICHAVSRWLQPWSAPFCGGTQSELAFSQHCARLIAIAASRNFPGVVCLPKSLALQAVLARRGIRSDLCVGVASDECAGFHAHAWVEVRNVPVNDTHDVTSRFSSITRLQMNGP